MTGTINAYDTNSASVTLRAVNLLPDPDDATRSTYQPLDPTALGKASPQIRIVVRRIGDAPVSGDFSQGLPKEQVFGTGADIHTTVLVDTGSFNTVLPKSLFAGILSDEQLATYPAASISYSSDNNTGTGVWVPMEIGLVTADGREVTTRIPVVVQLTGKTDYMMGVGFNIGRGIAGSMPDTSTYANAFLNLEPTAGGTPSRGYIIDGTGIHLGLTAAEVGSDWALQKLQPSARSAPAGAPPDWQAATVAGTLDYPANGTTAATEKTISPAGLLMDTGVTKTFIKTHDGLDTPGTGAKVSLDLFGTQGQVGYRYVLGGDSPQQPTTPSGSAVVTGAPDPGRFNLLNTGVHFLSGFDYLYDAENGYVGVRANAAKNDDLTVSPLVSVSGDTSVPDGFMAAAPLFLAGNATLSVPGTATLSGGMEGPGTLTLGSGTLVLSGPSATASLLLEPGTVLRVPSSLVLAKLDANGRATLDVAPGAVVQAAAGFVPPTGGPGYGLLAVTGGGTLSIGGVTVASGHSVLAGTIAGLNGTTIPGFVPGDVIEVNGTNPVTARYDAASGTLAISDGNQVATLTLATPPAATGFTVGTDSRGDSLVQLAAPVLAFTNASTGGQGTASMDAAGAGGPDYLRWQYIATGSDTMAFTAATPNVFIRGGAGTDAIAVTSGRNVVDGGGGSNFMVGGTGTDTFFIDARATGTGPGGVVWNTIVNFHAGDAVTLWGFDPAVSSYRWDDAPAGADGAKGATLRANITGGAGRAGDGVDASITFAGLGVEQARSMLHSTGDIPGGAGKYLYLYNQGV